MHEKDPVSLKRFRIKSLKDLFGEISLSDNDLLTQRKTSYLEKRITEQIQIKMTTAQRNR